MTDRITPERLAGVLTKWGIIDSCAIEDPEGYDNYNMHHKVTMAAKELSELLKETDHD